MTTFLNKCAFLLQEYGVSYLRGAGTTQIGRASCRERV